MKISLRKKQARFLNEVIQHWGEEALIDDATKGRLTNSIEVRPFDWKKLAEYSFWISIICIIISLVAVVADEALIHFVEQFFSASNLMLCLTFGVIAGGFYYWGYVSGPANEPYSVNGNEPGTGQPESIAHCRRSYI